MTSRFSRLEILDSKTVWGFVIKKFESCLHKFSDIILGILFKAIRHKTITIISATVLVNYQGNKWVDNNYPQYEVSLDIQETTLAVYNLSTNIYALSKPFVVTIIYEE